MARWLGGSEVWWLGGSVVRCFGGSVDLWFSLVRWFGGSTVQWFGGVVLWFGALVVKEVKVLRRFCASVV